METYPLSINQYFLAQDKCIIQKPSILQDVMKQLVQLEGIR